jgi:hypothetical protein
VEWMTRVPAFKGKPELLGDMLARACTVLRYVTTDLGPAGILRFAPDILTFKIARAAFLVTKVSLEFVAVKTRRSFFSLATNRTMSAAIIFHDDHYRGTSNALDHGRQCGVHQDRRDESNDAILGKIFHNASGRRRFERDSQSTRSADRTPCGTSGRLASGAYNRPSM